METNFHVVHDTLCMYMLVSIFSNAIYH